MNEFKKEQPVQTIGGTIGRYAGTTANMPSHVIVDFGNGIEAWIHRSEVFPIETEDWHEFDCIIGNGKLRFTRGAEYDSIDLLADAIVTLNIDGVERLIHELSEVLLLLKKEASNRG